MSDEKRKRRSLLFFGLVGLAVGATVLGLALLVNIFQRKQGAQPILQSRRAHRRHGRSECLG
jgi:hypothetical protein